VVVDLGTNVDLTLDVEAENIAHACRVKPRSIGDRPLRHARAAAVVDADQCIAAGRPVGHSDNVLDELKPASAHVEIDALFLTLIGQMRRAEHV